MGFRAMNNIRRGWRYFTCDECGYSWKWPSRDCFSLSGEDCPRCNNNCIPNDNKVDESIPADKWGNLTVPYNWNGYD